MRKVVNFDEENVNITEINNQSNIGVKWAGGIKTLVVQDREGIFRGLSNDSFHLMHSWGKETKQEYVKSAISQAGSAVYEFATKKELLTWFAKN